MVFWFSIFASAFRYYHFLISTLHLKAKNNSLIEQMRIERSETVKVNKLLIASNEKLDASNAIAMFPVHGDSAVDLIQQADLTIYDQKRKQRGSIGVFNETLPNEIKREQRRSILLKLIALLYRIALKRVIP